MLNSKLIRLLAVVVSLFFAQSAFAGIAVIVNPGVSDSPSKSDIAKLFLGKKKKFGGGKAAPLNQPESSDITALFNDQVIGKSNSQLKSYWSKLIFTGKGTPPKEMASDDAVKAEVASNPSAIGYIDEASVDDTVKVILTL